MTTVSITTFSEIAKIYLKREFWIDLVSVIPLQLIFFKQVGDNQYLLLLKVIRMKDVPLVFSASNLISNLRSYTQRRAERMIANNDPRAQDKNQNNTFIKQLVYVHQILKIVESFFSLVVISFFLGIFWYLVCRS